MNDYYYTTAPEAVGITFALIYLLMILFILAFCLAMYLLTAIPTYSLAKKHGVQNPWLAFIPFIFFYTCAYLLAEIPGKKPLFLLGDNLVFKDRRISFWISVAAAIVFLPATYLFHYGYLRDLLYLYEADEEKARNKAILVSVLDFLLTGGIAKVVILFQLIKAEPLAEPPADRPLPEKALTF